MAPTFGYTDGSAVWVQWTTASNTTASYTDTTWPLWCANATAGTCSATYVWCDWNAANYAVAPPPETDEQRTARELRQAEERAQREMAKTRARELLQSVLTRRQRTELEKDGHFHVHTRDGVRVYRLKPGSNPVRIQDEAGRRHSYCIHPDPGYPADDVTAALKLMLDADEEQFLRTANATALGAAA